MSKTRRTHVVIGGGSSGIVVAGKLLECDDVILIESGNFDLSEVSYDMSGSWLARLLNVLSTDIAWTYKAFHHGPADRPITAPQPNLCNRSINYVQGQGGGGSGAVNAMIFTTGSSLVYDKYWPESWGGSQIQSLAVSVMSVLAPRQLNTSGHIAGMLRFVKESLPSFLSLDDISRNNGGGDDAIGGNSRNDADSMRTISPSKPEARGMDDAQDHVHIRGESAISDSSLNPTGSAAVCDAFFASVNKLGTKKIKQAEAFFKNSRVVYWDSNSTSIPSPSCCTTEFVCDSSKPTLTIVHNATVEKIQFKNQTAVSVLVTVNRSSSYKSSAHDRNGNFCMDTTASLLREFSPANGGEIILCAGVFQSPLILMRSGLKRAVHATSSSLLPQGANEADTASDYSSKDQHQYLQRKQNSGIVPEQQQQEYDIPPALPNLPAIGENLQDHVILPYMLVGNWFSGWDNQSPAIEAATSDRAINSMEHASKCMDRDIGVQDGAAPACFSKLLPLHEVDAAVDAAVDATVDTHVDAAADTTLSQGSFLGAEFIKATQLPLPAPDNDLPHCLAAQLGHLRPPCSYPINSVHGWVNLDADGEVWDEATSNGEPPSAHLLFVDGRISPWLTELLLPRFQNPFYAQFLRPIVSYVFKVLFSLSILQWICGFCFGVLVCVTQPHSRGRVELPTTGRSRGAGPQIDPCYLSDERDITILRNACNAARRIVLAYTARASASPRVALMQHRHAQQKEEEFKPASPGSCKCGWGRYLQRLFEIKPDKFLQRNLCAVEVLPGPLFGWAQRESSFRQYVALFTNTYFHGCGTCAMPRRQFGRKRSVEAWALKADPKSNSKAPATSTVDAAFKMCEMSHDDDNDDCDEPCDDGLYSTRGIECGSYGCKPSSSLVSADIDTASAVVDADLRVLGVRGLRVADASVFPAIPSAPIEAVCMAVGLRCAQLIIANNDEANSATNSSTS